jgi:TrmH family RNA methyltransferase
VGFPVTAIASVRNPRVAAASQLQRGGLRDKQRRFLVEGRQTVLEALASGAPLVDLFVGPQLERPGSVLDEARTRRVPVHQATAPILEHLTSTVTPQGVVAVCEYLDLPLIDLPAEADLVVVLAEVRDPGNAGTILRSADAFGADAVVFSTASVDPYNPKTVRASAGSLFHLPIVRGATGEDVAREVRSRGLTLLATGARAERSVYDTDLTVPVALVFGNEAHGIGPGVRALVDGMIRVPIRRAESLNLAAAATVVLAEAARQRAARPRR